MATEGTPPLLDAAIKAINTAKKISGMTAAGPAFYAVSVLLAMIKESMVNQQDYVELGLFCADICGALERGMNGKKPKDLSQSVRDGINRLTTTVEKIQVNIIKQRERSGISRFFCAGNDKEAIAAWRSELNRIVVVFNTELAMNTYTVVTDIRQDMLKTRKDTDNQSWVVQNSARGESPPPPLRIFFGRDELIGKIVGLAERLQPIALIGAGGIGKTSIALTVLHDDRIKRRFGDDRRFIRCDKFPPSLPHFLRQLSKVIGAGIKSPKDLTPLRPLLSSNDMIVVLDKAESILDLRGTDAKEIYAVVEELSQMSNICLCITSRISTFPSDFEWLDIQALPMEAACDTFYRIHKHGERSDLVVNVLQKLDFHPLSITLLATVARHNKWGADRLASEWDNSRTDILQAEHKSLAATIELSFSSPTFQELGPNARELLGIIAFFPQGVHENNIDWLFPTIVGRKNIFDKFCALSLTHRNDGFITMLAPIRDYLSPKTPASAPLLHLTRKRYFSRLSVDVEPGKPGFEEARWIMLEDTNVEHLLDVFTTIDATSGRVWSACANFMKHLLWHKPRLSTLGPKIEALPDGHPSKLECLYQLSRLFQGVGNHAEGKRLLTHTSKLSRERGDDHQLTRTLRHLSRVHLAMGLYEEGIRQAKEGSEIAERLGDPVEQARCLVDLTWLLDSDNQLDAAEEAASRAIDLLPDTGEEFLVCRCHRVLGEIYCSKGETWKATRQYKIALRTATPFNWHNLLFGIHYSMAQLFFNEGRFDDAHTHAEHAKSHAVDDNDTYTLARAMWLQAGIWRTQHRLEEAKSEALRAIDVFEKLGASNCVEAVRGLLRQIESDARRKGRSYHPS